MLVFLLLCAFFQTLWGKPLPPPLGPSFEVAANTTSVTVSECPSVSDDGGQQLRSVYDIVQSCLFTIFACVWTSIHPNINGSRDSQWTRIKRKMVTTLCAVIAPELVLFWALEQRFSAKEIADKYNDKFKTFGETETSTWANFTQYFQPLPKSTTRRHAKQQWSITHGFFIQMGGFILYDGEYPKKVLDYDDLEELLEQKAIDAPTVTESDIQDKSKGDTISKAIVVLQTTWFVLQCIVRTVQHLPLSELEVLTLAFAVMNGAIYGAWWSKPQGVDKAICVPLKQTGTYADNSHSAPTSSHPTGNQQFDDKQPLMPAGNHESDEPMDETDSWLRQTLRKDRRKYGLSSPVFLLVRLPYHLVSSVIRLVWSVVRSLYKLLDGTRSRKDLRLSMFYARGSSTNLSNIVACIIGMVFGAIHLLGWSLDFPSKHDRILWQISGVVLTVTPLALLLWFLALSKNVDVLGLPSAAIFALSIPFYIVGRFVVIAIAFKAILHPPHNVLLDISWTRYIPHF